jgi:hypothetical protein
MRATRGAALHRCFVPALLALLLLGGGHLIDVTLWGF